MGPLVQAEADRLRVMPKRLTSSASAEFALPPRGSGRVYEAKSVDERTAFLFDVNRPGTITSNTRCTDLDKPIGQLLDEYPRWVRAGITVEEVGGAYELTTPFLDRHNDHLQIYVRRENGHLLLTDDGAVLADLAHSGCTLDSTRRRAMLGSILGGFGIAESGGALTTTAHNGDFPRRKHALDTGLRPLTQDFPTPSPLPSPPVAA